MGTIVPHRPAAGRQEGGAHPGDAVTGAHHAGGAGWFAGPAAGDPEGGSPAAGGHGEQGFALLVSVVGDLSHGGSGPPLSGVKDQLRKRQPDFSEKAFGFSGFLQFCKAAKARGLVTMEWDEQADDYVLEVADAQPANAAAGGGGRKGRR